MPVGRRLELLRYANSVGASIIEDDYDGEFHYEARPVSALQGLASSTRIFYLGTFSKSMFADIRIGYIVVQEVLPKAEKGDVRMFMMNGEPLMAGGEYAAFRRVNMTGDRRSNVRAGGSIEPAKVTPAMLELADLVRPKLLLDGMFLVGLDVVGDKLMEVNVFSPGGLGSAEKLYGVNFADVVIDALEHKVELRRQYGESLANRRLATL